MDFFLSTHVIYEWRFFDFYKIFLYNNYTKRNYERGLLKMSEKKNIIMVSEEDRNMVQRADVEMSSRRDIIAFMITTNMDISTSRFNDYQKDYSDKYYAFESAKQHIQDKYLNGLNAGDWTLDYNTCELIYSVKE